MSERAKKETSMGSKGNESGDTQKPKEDAQLAKVGTYSY